MPATYTPTFLRRLLRRRSSTSSSRSPSVLSQTPPTLPPLPFSTEPKTDHGEHDPIHTCQICNEPHYTPRVDGTIETPSLLPCSHIFGSACISQWLDSCSPNKDCPSCRRVMRYRDCGCAVRPMPLYPKPTPTLEFDGTLKLEVSLEKEVEQLVVREHDMPAKCWVCRCLDVESDEAGAEISGRVRMMMDRMVVEERALEGLKGLSAPGLGFFGSEAMQDLSRRMEESRGYWRGELERLNLEMMRERRAW